MNPLEKTFLSISNTRVKYVQDKRYITIYSDAIESGHLVGEKNFFGREYYILRSDELIIIKNRQGHRERVLIGSFPKDREYRIQYAGDNAACMWNTVESLKLASSCPQNLGEAVFFLFKGHLKNMKDDEKPIMLEQRILTGWEKHLVLVVRKLLHVYNGNLIDSEFYRNTKKTKDSV